MKIGEFFWFGHTESKSEKEICYDPKVFWNLSCSFIFFSAVYTIYLYSYSQHGSIYSGLYSCSLGYVGEFLLLFLHVTSLKLFNLTVDFTGILV
jgi:hypothetical protein